MRAPAGPAVARALPEPTSKPGPITPPTEKGHQRGERAARVDEKLTGYHGQMPPLQLALQRLEVALGPR